MAKREKTVPLGNRQSLALPIELEEGAPPIYYRGALGLFSGLIIMLLIWANIAQVRETSLAVGQITPSESVRQIAHLEGGIVDSVAVSQGDSVEAGDVLMRLRVESGDGSFAQYEARQADLRARIERLTAQAEGREPDFTALAKDWSSFVADQRAIFETARAEQALKIEAALAREEATRAERDGAEVAVKEKALQLDLSKEQLRIQEELIEGGFTSKQSHLEAKSAFLAAEAALNAAETQNEQALRNHNSAVAERERAEAEYRTAASKERAEAVAQLAELEEALVGSKDRDNRLVVRAPVAGVVNNLTVTGNGDVIRPGEVVAEIVPINAEMIADVRVEPKDIGYVEIGQEAEITVTTFDPKKFGVLKGEISKISADSFIDEKTGASYYEVRIKFAGDNKKSNDLISKLTPGMETNVKIITNTRSMMIYLLKPVARSLDNAFSER